MVYDLNIYTYIHTVNRSTLVENPLHQLQRTRKRFHKQPRWYMLSGFQAERPKALMPRGMLSSAKPGWIDLNPMASSASSALPPRAASQPKRLRISTS